MPKSSGAKKNGRPTIFTTLVAKKVVQLIGANKTEKQAAEIIGVTDETIRNWKAKYQGFSWSVNEAKQAANEMVEASLFHRAIGYTHVEEKIFCDKGAIVRAKTLKHYPPDSTAGIYWLNNRNPKRWKDKRQLDVGYSGLIRLNTGHEKKDYKV